MLTIGDQFPRLTVPAQHGVTALLTSGTLGLATAYPGKWTILFCWRYEISFVCPTEIVGRKPAGDASRH